MLFGGQLGYETAAAEICVRSWLSRLHGRWGCVELEFNFSMSKHENLIGFSARRRIKADTRAGAFTSPAPLLALRISPRTSPSYM
jgi:hypothetical protein